MFVFFPFFLRPRKKRKKYRDELDEFLKGMRPYARRLGISELDLKAAFFYICTRKSPKKVIE